MPDDLLTVTEAAERMNLSPITIRDMLHNGRFPGAKKYGQRAWLIPASNVEPGGWRKAYTFFCTESELKKLSEYYEKITE